MAEKKTKTAAPKSPAARVSSAKAEGSPLKIQVRNLKAETVGEAMLPEDIFGVPFRRHLVWEVVKQIRAREQRGIHKTEMNPETYKTSK